MLDDIPKLTAAERSMLDRFRDDESPDPLIARRVLQGVRAQLDDSPTVEAASPWWLWFRAGGLSVAIAAGALLVLGGTARVVSRVRTPAPLEAADTKVDETPAKTTEVRPPAVDERPSAPATAIDPVPSAEIAPVEVSPTPLAVDPAGARTKIKPAARPTTSVDAAPVDAAAEIALFKAIKVERDAKQRLAAIDRYHREFAKGSFVQEVAVLEIGALCDLGRTSDAEAKSAAFQRTFGGSAFSGIAKRGCSEGGK